MATVSVRVPEELKQEMEAHEDVNWSAVIREHIREELEERDDRNLASAVATSERLSAAIDEATVADQNTAERIREWRDRRYGPT